MAKWRKRLHFNYILANKNVIETTNQHKNSLSARWNFDYLWHFHRERRKKNELSRKTIKMPSSVISIKATEKKNIKKTKTNE